MSAMTAVAKTSKNKEKAVKLLELVRTDKELYNMICFGLEGRHYNRLEGDYIEILQDGGYAMQAEWIFGNQFNAYLLRGQDGDIWTRTKEMNDAAKKSPIAGFILNTDPIKTELSQIATVKSEFKSVSKGSEDMETYEKMVAKLREAGVEKVRLEIKKQIDEYLKNIKK
jgi:putative aldouronate transport system substrate-binding protein